MRVVNRLKKLTNLLLGKLYLALIKPKRSPVKACSTRIATNAVLIKEIEGRSLDGMENGHAKEKDTRAKWASPEINQIE